MATRPDLSEVRRDQILDAALVVFARLGFHTARMDDIAQEARLSKGALYWYFKSKDDIIAALLDRIFRRDFQGLQDLLSTDISVSEKLVGYTRQMASELADMTLFAPIAFEFYGIAGRNDEVRSVLNQYLLSFQEAFSLLVRQGIDSGEFRDVDPQATATTISALHEGLVLLWFVNPAAVPVVERAESSMRLLLDGLRKK